MTNKNRRTNFDHARVIAVVVTTLFLAASCAEKPVLTALGDTLNILGPTQALIKDITSNRHPAQWDVVGEIDRHSITIREIERTTAVQFAAGSKAFAFATRVNAHPLSMPYLSWSWRGVMPRDGDHPVRLFVGLASKAADAERRWWQVGKSEAEVNRIVDIAWGETALKRGALYGPRKRNDGQEAGTYYVRGGAEQTGQWRHDTVDLAQIIAQLWPNEGPDKMTIKYIGVGVYASKDPSPMNIAAIRLTR